MRSATSSFKTLLRSDWKHCWPLCFLYTFVLFFMMPVSLWNAGHRSWYADVTVDNLPLLHMNNRVVEMIATMPAVTMLIGVGLAMALFSYLMRANSVGLMHALPVSRGTQFAAHFTAGMTMLTAGNVVTFLLSALMEAVSAGAVGLTELVLWLLIAELEGFFFLAFAVLCAVVTGWVLAVPVIYAGVNFMVMAYRLLLSAMAGAFLRGYTGQDSDLLSSIAEWCTPVVRLTQDTRYHGASLDLRDTVVVYSLRDGAMTTVLIYTAVGIAMLFAAYLFYRARHSETAGSAVTIPWLRPVVRYVIAVAGGLGLGMAVYQLVSWGRDSVTVLVLCQIVMGVLVYCAVEMLLRKTYRIFDRRTLAGLTALALVLVLIPTAMKLDLFGYQRRVPVAEDVQSVELNGTWFGYTASSDPDTVAAAQALQRLLIDSDTPRDEDSYYAYLYVRYILNNGDTLTRSYDYNAEDPAVAAALEALVNRPDVRMSSILYDYGRFGTTFTGGYANNWISDRQTVLSAEQCAALYDAIEQDARIHVSLETLQRQYYTGTAQAQMELELSTTEGSYHVYNVTPECTHVLALLHRYGVFDDAAEIFPADEPGADVWSKG